MTKEELELIMIIFLIAIAVIIVVALIIIDSKQVDEICQDVLKSIQDSEVDEEMMQRQLDELMSGKEGWEKWLGGRWVNKSIVAVVQKMGECGFYYSFVERQGFVDSIEELERVIDALEVKVNG